MTRPANRPANRSANGVAPALLLSGLLALLLVGPVVSLAAEPPAHLQPPEGVSAEAFQRSYAAGENLQLVYRSIYESVRPSVVRVLVEAQTPASGQAGNELMNDPFFRRFFGKPDSGSGNQKLVSFGTGFIVDASGLIVTNSHVVGEASTAKIVLHDGREVQGDILGRDHLTDVALIRIQAKNLQAARLGDSDSLHVGDTAIAVGNPFGLDGTFTTGVISGLHRAGLDESGMRFIQTDASINQGNSGGPLLNLRGEVVGINRMIFSPTGGSIGLAFAIPVNEVRHVMRDLAQEGRVLRPFLGVQVEAREGRGAFVRGVVRNSGAHQAGILPGDVIVRLGSDAVRGPEDVVSGVRARKPGDRVRIQLVRKDRNLTVEAEIRNLELE